MSYQRFHPTRKPTRLSLLIKFFYGCGGIVAILALSNGAGRDNATLVGDPHIEPSVWYWQWLPGETCKASELVDPDEELFDDSDSKASGNLSEDLPWGTDARGSNLREWIGRGATEYLIYAPLCCIVGLTLALGWAFVIEWPRRVRLPAPWPLRPWERVVSNASLRVLNTVNDFPKFLLLLGIYAAGGQTMARFTLGLAIFLAFGATAVFRDRLAGFLESEEYLYALELGLPPQRILIQYVFKRRMGTELLIRIPFMLCSFVMWESTMSFLDLMIPGSHSWGHLIRMNFLVLHCDNWSYLIPLVCLLFISSALYVLGDALQDRLVDGAH